MSAEIAAAALRGKKNFKSICSCGAAHSICAFRRSASLYLFGGEHPWLSVLLQNSGAKRAARTGSLAPSAPAIAGEGDHWSSRSERTVVEGARDSTCCWRCKTMNVGAELALNCLRRVESGAPSTALRAVPLPRYRDRGGG
jgi:hypothetical protein